MEPFQWVDLVVSVSLLISFYTLIKLYVIKRSLVDLYFGLSALILFIGYLSHLFGLDFNNLLMNWSQLVSVTFYISGLLVLIRESKPVFARFPLYLTALPFVSILFFPLVIDFTVIKDLVNGIYQGGALIVSILVLTINNAKEIGQKYYMIGLTLVSISYLTYWIIFNRDILDKTWISEILFAAGILLVLFRFTKSNSVRSPN